MPTRFVKSDEPQRYTLGIVYEPEEVDSQDDFATAADIEKACRAFNRRLMGNDSLNKTAIAILDAVLKGETVEVEVDETIEKGALGLQHAYWGDDLGEIVESYIMPVDCEIDGEAIKVGTWMMGVVWSPEMWEQVQAGTITGYSMGGRAKKEKVNA